ncbi:MAG: hypothetical protein PUP46_09180, partial [Endozoicomonas sp. (ex Botrylloides leachii)]|nr:hypothetical protein [Endozoicomonas sp. (ex Botrylloides leachii)]
MKLFKPSNKFKKNLLYTAIAATLSGFSFGANAMIESVPAERSGKAVTTLDATIAGTEIRPETVLNVSGKVTGNVLGVGGVPYHTVDIKQGGKLSTNEIFTSNLVVAGKLLSLAVEEGANTGAINLVAPHRLYNTSDGGIAGLFYNEDSDFEFHKLNEQSQSLGAVPPENITTAQERSLAFTGTEAGVRFSGDNAKTFDTLTLTKSVLGIDLRGSASTNSDHLVKLDKIKVTGDGASLIARVNNSGRILTHDLDLRGKGLAAGVTINQSSVEKPTLLPVALYPNGDEAGNLQPYEVGTPGGAQVHVGSGYNALLDIVDHVMVTTSSDYDPPPAAAPSVEAASDDETVAPPPSPVDRQPAHVLIRIDSSFVDEGEDERATESTKPMSVTRQASRTNLTPYNSDDDNEEVSRSLLRRGGLSGVDDESLLSSLSLPRANPFVKARTTAGSQGAPDTQPKPFNVVHVHGTLLGKIVGRTALNVHSGGVFWGGIQNKTAQSENHDIVSHFYGGSTIKSAAIQGHAEYGTGGGLVTMMPMEPDAKSSQIVDLQSKGPIGAADGYSNTEIRLGGYAVTHTVKSNATLFIDGHHNGHVKVAGDDSSHNTILRFEPGSTLKLKHHDLQQAPLVISDTGSVLFDFERVVGTPIDVISENTGLISELMVSGTLEDTPIHIAELAAGSRVFGALKSANSLGYELTIDPVSTAVANGVLAGHISVASHITEKLPAYTGLNKSMTSVLRAHLDSLVSKQRDKTIQPKQAKALAAVLAADPAHAAALAKQTIPHNAVNGSSIESCASTARASWAHIEQRLNGVAALPSGVATGD